MRLIRTIAGFAVLLGFASSGSKTSLSSPAPMRLVGCEGVSTELRFCGGVWTFTGTTGKAKWPNNATADLTIERFDDEQVVIRRTDTGSSQGLTAVYTGKRKGYRIEGEVVYTWPAQWPEPKQGTFSVISENPEEFASTAHPKGPFPDVSGIWGLAKESTGGRESGISVAIFQNGAEIKMVALSGGQARTFSYLGHFESNTLISGQTCDSSYDKAHPYCILDSSPAMLLSPTRMKDAEGEVFDKVAGRNDPRYEQARLLLPPPDAKPYLPEQPFDLTGTWQSTIMRGAAGRVEFRQQNGLVYMFGPFGGYPVFAGWYAHNPAIGGTALSNASNHTSARWTRSTLFVQNPDGIVWVSEDKISGLFRASAPSPNNPPCSRENSSHVNAYYAWLRGAAALKQKNEGTASCWLTVSADAGLAAGQSLLAAVLRDATPPNYAAAFDLATRSAKQGDIMGELELAGFYRDGKGTAPDAAKAQYWETEAQHAKQAAQLREFNAKKAGADKASALFWVAFFEYARIQDEAQRAACEQYVKDHPVDILTHRPNSCG